MNRVSRTSLSSPLQKAVTTAVPTRTVTAAAPAPSPVIKATPVVEAKPTMTSMKPTAYSKAPEPVYKSRIKSPVIAPEIVTAPLPDGSTTTLPPEKAHPALTAPAANPYASDANWEPFPERPGAAVDVETTDDPFNDVADPNDFVPENATALVKTSNTQVAKVTTSWLDKLLGFIGLSRKKAVAATMAGEAAAMAAMSQTEAAAQLVRRARAGDQNAMAMIVCVREAAAKGNPKAIMSAKFMRDYILRNPVGEPTNFGMDEVIPTRNSLVDAATATAVRISHGPLLTNPRIGELVREAGFGAEEVNAFRHGMAGRAMRNPNPRIQKANRAGALIGHARKLQAVRRPDTRVSKFDANIGWELGEDIT